MAQKASLLTCIKDIHVSVSFVTPTIIGKVLRGFPPSHHVNSIKKIRRGRPLQDPVKYAKPRRLLLSLDDTAVNTTPLTRERRPMNSSYI